MIGRSGVEQILQPAKPRFIWLSLLVAFCVELLPLGVLPWRPDVLMLALAFWCIYQPQRVGMGVAFFFGLLMDVNAASLLGQQALAYAVLVFVLQSVRNRLLWYSSGLQQAVLMWQFFMLAHAVVFAVGYVSSAVVPGWAALLAPVAQAALWPLVRWILLAPQMRPPEQDDHRPL